MVPGAALLQLTVFTGARSVVCVDGFSGFKACWPRLIVRLETMVTRLRYPLPFTFIILYCVLLGRVRGGARRLRQLHHGVQHGERRSAGNSYGRIGELLYCDEVLYCTIVLDTVNSRCSLVNSRREKERERERGVRV